MEFAIRKYRNVGKRKNPRAIVFSFIREVAFPVKASNGNYWKACSHCKYQFLWDGGTVKGVAYRFCPNCGRSILWFRKKK